MRSKRQGKKYEAQTIVNIVNININLFFYSEQTIFRLHTVPAVHYYHHPTYASPSRTIWGAGAWYLLKITVWNEIQNPHSSSCMERGRVMRAVPLIYVHVCGSFNEPRTPGRINQGYSRKLRVANYSNYCMYICI